MKKYVWGYVEGKGKKEGKRGNMRKRGTGKKGDKNEIIDFNVGSILNIYIPLTSIHAQCGSNLAQKSAPNLETRVTKII